MTGLLAQLLTPDRLVDLSQEIGPATVPWPGSPPLVATVTHTHERDGVFMRSLALPEHLGTHFDAPSHFAPDGLDVHELDIGLLVREAAVIDAAAEVGDDPDHAISADLVLRDEERHGRIPAGAVAVFRTGWDRYVRDPLRYAGGAHPRLPGLAADAAEVLVDRAIAGIGIDSLSIDVGSAEDAPVHRTLLSRGIWVIEGLVGLERLPARGAWLVVAPMLLRDGSGTPARAFAILPA